ncbi:MAG: SurA N-terminal domain-containing protein [Candidatus Krumholzibacteriota bacterium]|nr:SurA N-terminal domain-containing protein [Candidatus Krumholzibacteriota bacterium]
MMRQLRENTKTIIWIVVVAFLVTIFAVWGLDLQTGGIASQGPNLIGKVDGVPITPQAYQAIYTQLAQQYRSISPTGQLNVAQQELLRDQAWNNIVTSILTEKEIDKLGITVSDEEVVSFLRNSPPPEVRQYFVDANGNFDFAAYQTALNNPDADWTAVEQLARQRIPLIKLNQYLLAQVHVGRDEILHKYEEETTRMVAQYVAFPVAAETSGNYEPSDAEIAAYYGEHSDDFRRLETAILDYIRIPIEPTETDREDIAYLMRTIREELGTGGDFEALARMYSEGPNAQQGGDAGFVRAEEIDPAVLTAIGVLETGAVSGPVWTADGASLIKLVDTRQTDGQDEYHIQEIELRLNAGAATIDSLSNAAQELAARAIEAGLSEAAAERNLAVTRTPAFIPDVPIQGLGFVPTMSRFAFSHTVDEVSPVLNDDDNYYVCGVVDRTPETVTPLEEVRDNISVILLEDRKREIARREAAGFFRSLADLDASFAKTAANYGLTVEQTDTFSVRERAADGIPPYSAFSYAALTAPDVFKKLLSPPVETDGVFYVIHVLYRSKLDVRGFEGQSVAIRDRLFQRKVQQYMAWWYENLREKSNIEDYRVAS